MNTLNNKLARNEEHSCVHNHDHEHDHEHNLDHEHDHEHAPHLHSHGADCTCGCNHDAAESIIEEALIFSRKGTVELSDICSADDALNIFLDKMLEVAEMVSVDNVIFGHIKGLFESLAGTASISITDVGSPHIAKLEGWDDTMPLAAFTLTVNVLSLAHTDAPVAVWADTFLEGN